MGFVYYTIVLRLDSIRKFEAHDSFLDISCHASRREPCCKPNRPENGEVSKEGRRHYCWYLKGVPHSGYYKEQSVQMSTLEDVYRVTKGIKRDLT